jgi:uncharacterized NAD(P)/FAD-binding protein YdhS
MTPCCCSSCRRPLAFATSCPSRTDVAIVGGGFSGLMTLVHVLRRLPHADVTVIEREPRPGPGLAYGACGASHLLNVPADRMGAFPDDPRGFFDWLETHEPGRFQPHAFVPRALYGAYLHHVVAAIASPARATFVRGSVVRLVPDACGSDLTLASGERIRAGAVVLALGLPMATPAWGQPDACGDPWSPATWDAIGRDDRVLVAGTGLTALDVLASLEARGHRGSVHFVSRSGRFPLPHAAVATTPAAPVHVRPEELAMGPRQALRAIRRLVRARRAAGLPWQPVLDAVRPHAAGTWQRWSARDRNRFLRRLRPFWEVHRHRAPQAVLDRLAAGVASGRITCSRGEVVAVDRRGGGLSVTLRTPARTHARADADHLINCIGPSLRVSDSREPLLRSLLDAGQATTDAAGLGVCADGGGRLVDAEGAASRTVFVLGALRRGELWESTAVPELRAQAAVVGACVADLLVSQPILDLARQRADLLEGALR